MEKPQNNPIECGENRYDTNIPTYCNSCHHGGKKEQNGLMGFMQKHHTLCFSLVIFGIIIIMGCFLWCSNMNLKTSQNKIVGVFQQTQMQTESNIRSFIQQSNSHRNSLQACVDKQMKLLTQLSNGNAKDSMPIYAVAMFIQLEADVKFLEEQNNVISRLATDSLSRKYDAMINNVLSEKMLELHLAKIEHEYTNITIWAALLTIIFLVFSFFSLFKIEQSRTEIQDLSQEGRDMFGEIIRGDQSRKAELEGSIEAYKTALDGLYKEYSEKLSAITIKRDE